MAIQPREPSPLDYQSPGARRSIRRWTIVTLAGAIIALVGAIVFFFAHEISNQTARRTYNPDRATMHEFIWGAFGIALLLVGGLLAAVGLMSWCRDDAE
jgi:hypothetical protein